MSAEPEPVVSVVTPLFNSAPHIDATLASLQRQTFPGWEAILVDDGSTDDTADRVAPFLADGRFRYLHQANRGIGAARNRGIGAARGDWVALLDHDDRWRPDKLERQLDGAARHGWDLVCSDADVLQDGRRRRYSTYLHEDTRRALEHPGEPPADLYALLIRMNFLCASTVLVRRALFREHGLLDASVAPADDYDMWLRCAPHARIGYVPEPLAEYVLHETNHSWRSVEMRLAAVRVLLRTLVRTRGDAARQQACADALVVHHALLFEELLAARAHATLARRAWHLGRYGVPGLRILRRAWRTRHDHRAGF